MKLPLYGLACADRDAAPEKAASAAPDPQPAKEILARTAQVYAECASYRDTGSVVTTFHTGDGTSTRELSFSTAFVRPDRFHFEYAEEGSSTGAPEYVIWRHGGEVRSWWDLRPGVKKEDSLNMALAAATGVSAGSAHTVPSLLMPKEVEGRRLSDLTDAVHKADEPVEGHACFVVEGKIPPPPPKVAEKRKLPRPYPILSWTVWIDEATYVVRKVEMTLPTSRGDAVEVTTYEPALNAAVPDSALVFNPPATP
ncbi:MAG: hypothetical protein B7X11_04125 [Acidobacteria bacterium 37-65-4]|nr:MAG: hypothetical protein B7X11_04125 [Acidobacteria bacterium 37-65-4]